MAVSHEGLPTTRDGPRKPALHAVSLTTPTGHCSQRKLRSVDAIDAGYGDARGVKNGAIDGSFEKGTGIWHKPWHPTSSWWVTSGQQSLKLCRLPPTVTGHQ